MTHFHRTGSLNVALQERIDAHKEILKNKGVVCLGEKSVGSTLKTTLKIIKFLSAVTVILFIPTSIAVNSFYKRKANQLIENDNIALIRSRCLFTPNKTEIAHFHRAKILKTGEFIHLDNPERVKEIGVYRELIKLSKEANFKESQNWFIKHLRNKSNTSDLNQLKRLPASVYNSKSTLSHPFVNVAEIIYTHQLVDQSDKTECFLKALSLLTSSKPITDITEKEWCCINISLDAYSTIKDVSVHGGKVIDNQSSKNDDFLANNSLSQGSVLNSQTREILSVSKSMIPPGKHVLKDSDITLQLCPYIEIISNKLGNENAIKFVKIFNSHSYMKKVFAKPFAEGKTNERFAEEFKNWKIKLDSAEDQSDAIEKLTSRFNRPREFQTDLRKLYGHKLHPILNKYFDKYDRNVFLGAVAVKDSRFYHLAAREQMNLIEPDLIRTFNLSKSIIRKFFIRNDLTQENLQAKITVLEKLQSNKNYLVENLPSEYPHKDELINHILRQIGGPRLQASNQTLDHLTNVLAFLISKQEEEHLTPASIAGSLSLMIKKIINSKRINFSAAAKTLNSSIHHIFDRDSYREIRKKLINYANLLTVFENNDISAIERRFSIPKPFVEKLISQCRNIRGIAKADMLEKAIYWYQKLSSPTTNDLLVQSFALKLATYELDNPKVEEKYLNKIFDYLKKLNSTKKNYATPQELVTALFKVIDELSTQSSATEKERFKSTILSSFGLWAGANSTIKRKHQDILLRDHLINWTLNEFKSEDKINQEDIHAFFESFSENLQAGGNLPNSASIDYLKELIKFTLQLKITDGFSIDILKEAVNGNRLHQPLLKVTELDSKKNPKITKHLKSLKSAIIERATYYSKETELFTVDIEHLLFPIFFKMLPTFVRAISSQRQQHQVRGSLGQIETNFRLSKEMQQELDKAITSLTIRIPFFKNIHESSFDRGYNSLMHFLNEQIEKINSVISSNERSSDEDLFISMESQNINPIVIDYCKDLTEVWHSLHDKIQQIKAMKAIGKTPVIIYESESIKAEDQNGDQEIICFTIDEQLWLNLLDNIPSDPEKFLFIVNKAITAVNATGAGRWVAKKIVKIIVSDKIGNASLAEEHINTIQSNLYQLLDILLVLVPTIQKNHDIKKLSSSLNALKETITKSGEFDSKEALHASTAVVNQLAEELKEYKPAMFECLKTFQSLTNA